MAGKGKKQRTSSSKLPEWNLSDLYPGSESPELETDLKWVEEECREFTDLYLGKVAELRAPDLYECVMRLEEIETISGRIGSFAHLNYCLDTLDVNRGKLLGDCKARLAEASSQLAFLEIEISKITNERFEELLASDIGLARYRPFLDRVRKLRPHLLSLELEQFLGDKAAVGKTAWIRLFDETVAAMKFDVGGKRLNLEGTLNKLADARRSTRRKASAAIGKGLKQKLPVFSLIINTLAKEKAIEDKWRNYQSPQASRHLSNDVEPEIVEALRQAVVAEYPEISHRYYRLKAGWLGRRRLREWDRNAPLSAKSETKFSWNDARSRVLEAFGEFSPTISEIASRFFDHGWIDAEIRPGKASGAFSHPTVTRAHPYILLNYEGKPRDVMVLAHELGHGVHQVLAAKQGELLSRTPLTLAETASVFGEMLAFKSLLQNVSEEHEHRSMIAGKVEDMINTVIRQIAFYEFECRLHRRRAEGELMSREICDLWMEVQSESLGSAFKFSKEYRTHWAYVSHFFHVPFYVYAYAFGQGLVHALYAEYENGLPSFESKYVELLEAGGTRNHRELLEPFGLDIAAPEFWSSGLSLIRRMIDDLEAMET